MFVSLLKQCIYVGVPHTGSTSIHHYLAEMASVPDNHICKKWVCDFTTMKHASLPKIKDHLKSYGWDTDGWTVIYTKRNCLDYLLSEFFLMDRVSKRFKNGKLEKQKHPPWQSRIENWAENPPTLDKWIIDKTCRYNSHDDYEEHMSNMFLGPENTRIKHKIEEYTFDKNKYPDFFRSVCRKMALPLPKDIPWENDSNKEKQKMQLKEETIQFLRTKSLM